MGDGCVGSSTWRVSMKVRNTWHLADFSKVIEKKADFELKPKNCCYCDNQIDYQCYFYSRGFKGFFMVNRNRSRYHAAHSSTQTQKTTNSRTQTNKAQKIEPFIPTQNVTIFPIKVITHWTRSKTKARKVTRIDHIQRCWLKHWNPQHTHN